MQQYQRSAEWDNLAARLENYKQMQRKAAEAKGRTEELKAAKTLTQARKAVWGEKQKTPNCSGCGHKATACACTGRR